LEKKVHFLGYRRDVAQIMREVDIFVLPSRYEASGLVILEAIASGLPVITSRFTGASEVITDECGIVIEDPDDVNALATALRQLSYNRDKRIQMGLAAKKIAMEYSWPLITKEYFDLFEQLS